MNIESALRNLVRVGTVSSTNAADRTVRVAFADKTDSDGKPLISGPLKFVGRGLPDIGSFVLCLYLPNGESDGFVLGAICTGGA